MTQCQMLLDYMREHGSISGLESMKIGVLNYKGRIHDLRKLGFCVKTKMVTETNSRGEAKTFARYYLG